MFTSNLKELTKTHKEVTQKVFAYAGSIAHLALMLGAQPATVASWAKNDRISIKGAISIGDNPGLPFTKEDVRPEFDFSALISPDELL